MLLEHLKFTFRGTDHCEAALICGLARCLGATRPPAVKCLSAACWFADER